jgi:hypothetical protein
LGVVGGNAHVLQGSAGAAAVISRYQQGRSDLIRYFTLPPADIAFVDPGRGREPADRLAHLIFSPDLVIIA